MKKWNSDRIIYAVVELNGKEKQSKNQTYV